MYVTNITYASLHSRSIQTRMPTIASTHSCVFVPWRTILVRTYVSQSNQASAGERLIIFLASLPAVLYRCMRVKMFQSYVRSPEVSCNVLSLFISTEWLIYCQCVKFKTNYLVNIRLIKYQVYDNVSRL